MKIYRNKEMKISLKFYLVVEEELNFFWLVFFSALLNMGMFFAMGVYR